MTTIDQFRNCVGNPVARASIGLDITEDTASRLLEDDAALAAAFERWQAASTPSAETAPQPAAPEGPPTYHDPVNEEPPGTAAEATQRNPRAKPSHVSWAALGVAILAAAIGGYGIFHSVTSEQSLTEELSATTTSMNEQFSDTSDEINSVKRNVTDINRQRIDVGKVYDQSIDSIVTVYCGDSLGSGFSWEDVEVPAGYESVVITNNHVIEGCRGPTEADRNILIEKSDGTQVASYVLTWDEANDLALIAVKGAIEPLMRAEQAVIGDQVIAIGSPQGLSGSVTQGVISNVYSDAFQTDTAINHGNSGGPLLDRFGKVLGVTTFALDREGLNIAVRTTQLCEGVLECP